MNVSAAELSRLIHGEVIGDETVRVDRPSRIEEGQPGSLTFLANPKYESFAYKTQASIILVSKDFQPVQPVAATLIRVANVYESLATLLEHFEDQLVTEVGVSENAEIDNSAQLGKNVFIGAFVVVEAGAKIGTNAVIEPFAFIGKNTSIGESTRIHTGVKLYHNCEVGNRVQIHANSVIGSDGFGFVKTDGTFKKIKQIGNVIIEDDVEIGANVVIDRASIGSTIIRCGAKLDNLIQIAHNVEIGKNAALAAQSGVAGSTKIGADSLIGGQAGIVGHIELAKGTQVQAQSGVTTPTKEGDRLYGSPALDYVSYLKSYSVFRNLPSLAATIARLEKKVADLEMRLGEQAEQS